MARYRKIDTRVWGDAKFLGLSRPNPCGQFLWLYLLTGPHTGRLPGLANVGRLQLAEALGWSPEAFDQAFQEVSSRGMVEADWETRVVWIPRAIRYNPPESPNVLRAWYDDWAMITEGKLRDRYRTELQDYVEGMGEGFREAFREAWGEGIGEDLPQSGTGTGTGTGTGEGDMSTEPPAPPPSQETPLVDPGKKKGRKSEATLRRQEARSGEIETAEEILGYLSRRRCDRIPGSRHFSPSETNLGNILGRIRYDGITYDDAVLVIDYKLEEWGDDPKWRAYLTPTTLFRPSHFESYLIAASEWDAAGRGPIRENRDDPLALQRSAGHDPAIYERLANRKRETSGEAA